MPHQPHSGLAPIGRLFWMMIGPAILFLLTVTIAQDGGGWWTVKNVLFFAALAGMVLGRYVEFRGGDPRTAAGEPASPEHLRRYAAIVLSGGVVLWAALNFFGRQLVVV